MLVLSPSLTFIAEGTLMVTKDFAAGSESYSTVTIYSAFQSVNEAFPQQLGSCYPLSKSCLTFGGVGSCE